MNIEGKTKKQLQQYIRTYNQKELIKLKNIVKSCSNERYQKVSEELNEKLPKILDINRKKRIFSELDEDEIIADERELDSLRLLAVYYKNKGKFNNKYYCKSDIENLDKMIDQLKKECMDGYADDVNMKEIVTKKQSTDADTDTDTDNNKKKNEDKSNLHLIINENSNEYIKVQNRLIMCHNIIHAYSNGILKNTHFRLYIYTSKNDIEVSYKCNYKRSIFDSNEKIMSNVYSTRLIDRYKKIKSTNYFKNAKFSNSIKMVTIENNIGYNRAILCSITN